jgi:hypothetical protein
MDKAITNTAHIHQYSLLHHDPLGRNAQRISRPRAIVAMKAVAVNQNRRLIRGLVFITDMIPMRAKGGGRKRNKKGNKAGTQCHQSSFTHRHNNIGSRYQATYVNAIVPIALKHRTITFSARNDGRAVVAVGALLPGFSFI